MVSILLFYPTLEELLFRGVIQGQALESAWGNQRYLGISAANTLASILFALMHLAHHPPMWALAVFAPSLIYGYLRERYDSITPAITAHAFYNSVYLAAGYHWAK